MLLNFTQRGEGPPVILIHGLFGSAGNLGMVARGLAGDFSVYSLDIRNHGDSPWDDNMDYPSLAADVTQTLDHLGIDTCSILGHSMGGKIAMQLACDSPQRVNRLIVADVAPVHYPPHHDSTLAGLLAVEQAEPASRSDADAILARTIDEPGVRAFLLKSLRRGEDGRFRWLLNRPAIAHNYEALGGANSGQPYTGPTLFIKGSESDYITEDHREQIQNLFPNAQLKIIADTGHWLHAEKPTVFNRLVLDFLLG